MIELLPAWGLFLLMAATPGPNNALVAAMGAAYGIGRVQPLLLGIAGGVASVFTVSGLGLGAVLLAQPVLLGVMRAVGALLMLYIAIRIMFAPLPGANAAKPVAIGFAAGFALQWVNPKLWSAIFGIAALLPQPDSSTDLVWQTVTLATGSAAITIVAIETWTAFGALLARLVSTPRTHRIVCVVSALLVLASTAAALSFAAR